MSNAVVDRLWELTTAMAKRMPLVRMLGDPSLKLEHWERIFRRLGEQCPLDLNFTLDQLYRAGLAEHYDFCALVCRDARQAQAKRDVRAVMDDLVERVAGGGPASAGPSSDEDDSDEDSFG